MSWSISVIGKPENVAKALQEESAKMTGRSKVEYDDALPHLVGLVIQNLFALGGEAGLLDVAACGGGCEKDGQQISRDCTVSIKRHYATTPNWYKAIITFSRRRGIGRVCV